MVDLSYEFQYTCTGCPAQARGTVQGKPFCLRLHQDGWCFSVSEDPATDPACVDCEQRGFYREGEYGIQRDQVGCVPQEEAERIIRECAQQYRQQTPVQN